jgi:hypothetical protein
VRPLKLVAASHDIAFYYREDGKYLEQAELRSPDHFEQFRWPLIGTNLDEKQYLLESDLNIRCCLYNHPLKVQMSKHSPVLVALERDNARYRPTRSRKGPPNY